MAIGDELIRSLRGREMSLRQFTDAIRRQGIRLEDPMTKIKLRRAEELLPFEVEGAREGVRATKARTDLLEEQIETERKTRPFEIAKTVAEEADVRESYAV